MSSLAYILCDTDKFISDVEGVGKDTHTHKVLLWEHVIENDEFKPWQKEVAREQLNKHQANMERINKILSSLQ